jgi:hypothetical protein
MRYLKKQSVFGLLIAGGALAAVIGMIFYVITGVTGYLAGTPLDVWPILLPIFVFVIAAAVFVYGEKLKEWMLDLILQALVILESLSFVFFVMARLSCFADVWFIPVNYPAAELATVNLSVAGIVFTLLSVFAFIACGFMGKTVKEEALQTKKA